MRIAIGEYFHQPTIKIVHWVVHDGFEAAVVFSMSFFNVVFQSDADVSIFSAQPDLLRPKHLDVLHRNFGNAVRAAVQFLFFRRKAIDVELSLELFCTNRSGLDQLESFRLWLFFKGWRRRWRHSWGRRNLRGHGCWLGRCRTLASWCWLRGGSADQLCNLCFERRA